MSGIIFTIFIIVVIIALVVIRLINDEPKENLSIALKVLGGIILIITIFALLGKLLN